MRSHRCAILSFLFIATTLSLQPLHAGGWKWIAYGDTRTNRAAHRSVLAAIKAHTPDYRFMINVGDVTENGTQPRLWEIWKEGCDEILGGTGQSSVPPKYMSVIGNHEKISTEAGLENWKKFLPGQVKQFGNDGKFFFFDYEDARFVILNTEDSCTGPQQAMLLDAIRNNPKKWLFTIWHKPIFDFDSKRYEDAIHQTWGVPLYENGCDIMFMGHSHYYVRTEKLRLNGQKHPPLDSLRGTAQVVTGDGGAPHYASDRNHDGNGYMVAYAVDSRDSVYYGYTELEVGGDTLRLRHINSLGQVMDQAVYTPNPKPHKTGGTEGEARFPNEDPVEPNSTNSHLIKETYEHR